MRSTDVDEGEHPFRPTAHCHAQQQPQPLQRRCRRKRGRCVFRTKSRQPLRLFCDQPGADFHPLCVSFVDVDPAARYRRLARGAEALLDADTFKDSKPFHVGHLLEARSPHRVRVQLRARDPIEELLDLFRARTVERLGLLRSNSDTQRVEPCADLDLVANAPQDLLHKLHGVPLCGLCPIVDQWDVGVTSHTEDANSLAHFAAVRHPTCRLQDRTDRTISPFRRLSKAALVALHDRYASHRSDFLDTGFVPRQRAPRVFVDEKSSRLRLDAAELHREVQEHPGFFQLSLVLLRRPVVERLQLTERRTHTGAHEERRFALGDLRFCTLSVFASREVPACPEIHRDAWT